MRIVSRIVVPVILFALFAWLLASSRIVTSRAEKRAGDRPYCIQVADGPDYKEARSTLDFSALKMWGAHGGNHAVLVIGDVKHPELWHWSYRAQDFEPDAYGPPAIFCTPARHFASLPRPARPAPGEGMHFYLSGRYFSIPAAYRANVQTVSRRGITFFAVPPFFNPIRGTNARSLEERVDEFDYFVQVAFALDTHDLNLTKADPGRAVQVEDAGDAYGLHRQFVRRDSDRGSLEYFARGEDGRVTTTIFCVHSSLGTCLHRFERHGWTYVFHHPPLDVAQWQTLENNLAARTESFVSSANP